MRLVFVIDLPASGDAADVDRLRRLVSDAIEADTLKGTAYYITRIAVPGPDDVLTRVRSILASPPVSQEGVR